MNIERSYSRDELREAFEELRASEVQRIEGVRQFISAKPGPKVAITVSTHGNEPSGYAPYLALKELLPQQLQQGSVTFVANNIEATQRYFAAETFEEKRGTRFVDVNFNRLPEDVLLRADDTRYEIQRALQLYPIYQQFDAALDIHSTEAPSDPMIIEIKGASLDIAKGQPIQKVLTNIVPVQIGIPVGSLYGGLERSIPVFEIEAGSHENPESFQLAVRSAIAFLMRLGMIPVTENVSAPVLQEYPIVDSIVFPDASYRLVKPFEMFESIKYGQVIAEGDGPMITAPCDGHAIFAPKGVTPISIKEEVMFISSPMKEKNEV